MAPTITVTESHRFAVDGIHVKTIPEGVYAVTEPDGPGPDWKTSVSPRCAEVAVKSGWAKEGGQAAKAPPAGDAAASGAKKETDPADEDAPPFTATHKKFGKWNVLGPDGNPINEGSLNKAEAAALAAEKNAEAIAAAEAAAKIPGPANPE